MSRILVMDLQNRRAGEIHATVTRSYSLNGVMRLQGGTYTEINLPPEDALQDMLQFGRMIYIEDEDGLAPPWAGMIDPPWTATAPISMTAYNMEYLMSLRTPDAPVVLNGTFESVLRKLIDLVNAEGDLFLRMGDLGDDIPSEQQQLTVNEQPLWGQINDFAKRENVELQMRPVYEGGDPLTIYLDAGTFGSETGIMLSDGEGGNIRVVDAQVEGTLLNRVIGIGKPPTTGSRPRTLPMSDQASIDLYRLRSETLQFRTLTLQSSLNLATANALDEAKLAYLKLTIAIDKPSIFPACRLGNWFDVHAANIYLPGGIKGWRGPMRLQEMVYEEKANVITAILETQLEI